jgi:uncharacterized membrane protein
MKNWPKTEIIILLLLALPFVYLAFTWDQFPERVPIHFNVNGEPDNYASKTVGLLLLPAINFLTYLTLKYLPKIDPRKENYKLFAGRYKAIRLLTHLFMVFVFFLVTTATLHSSFLQPKLLLIGLALMFMLLGNYLSAVRPNFFVGIRTPWTLSSEEVWKKTHRFTGILWVAASIIFLIIIIFSERVSPAILLSYISFITIIPIVYSYLLYQKLPKHNGAH